jgi:hypothetical protein
VKRDESTEPILIGRGIFNLWAVSELIALSVRPNKLDASHHFSLRQEQIQFQKYSDILYKGTADRSQKSNNSKQIPSNVIHKDVSTSEFSVISL